MLLKYGLQPALMVGVLALWLTVDDGEIAFLAAGLGLPILLTVLERLAPRRPDWVQPPRYAALLAVVFLATGLFTAAVVEPLYAQTLEPALAELRRSLGLDIWPHEWPLLAQVFLAFFASEFIWYWIHRAEHRWQWVWRASGHGAHHAFKNLATLNGGANHPLEILLVLTVPAAIVESLFGAGAAIGGSVLLVLTLALLAHSNIELNTKGIGLLFTVNRYHIHHHSMVFDESNTNYGCAAIVWDRLFGTFDDGDTQETGTGPSQPSLWHIFLMPWREPVDTQTAPRPAAETAA